MTAWGATADNVVANRLRDARVPGIIGIALGAFAALLTIPPIEVRTITWSLLVGIVGASLGVWTVTRGHRRLGWGAIVISVVGIGLALLALQSSTTNLGYTFDAILVSQTFSFATPLIFGAIAGMFSERSGVVNIGLEGMMLMGAFWGAYGADKGGSWAFGLLCAMGVGGLMGR